MKKEEQFTPIFLYSDDKSREQLLSVYDNAIIELNQLVVEAESVLKREMSDKEKHNLKKEGASYIIDMVRGSFKFSDATERFNLDSQGISFDALRSQDAASSLGKHKYECDIYNGVFVRSESEVNRIIEMVKVYTNNERQNVAYKLGLKLAKEINEAYALGFLNVYNLTTTINNYGFLRLAVVNKFDYEVQVDYNQLLNIRDTLN